MDVFTGPPGIGSTGGLLRSQELYQSTGTMAAKSKILFIAVESFTAFAPMQSGIHLLFLDA